MPRMNLVVLAPLALLALALPACATPSRTFTVSSLSACAPGDGAPAEVRVASFNIRSGLESSLDRIGDVLEGMDADVVALQEVDVGVKRTGRVDQAKVLAERLGYEYAFAAAMKRGGGDYGIALLSRFPFTRAGRIELRSPGAWEPRVAIDAEVCAAGRPVHVVAVHTDFLPWSSADNGKQLARDLAGRIDGPFVLAGDLNETPGKAGPRALEALGLSDLVGASDEGPTFHDGKRRLDYIFVDRVLAPMVEGAVRLDVAGSDHIPVYADLRLDPSAWPSDGALAGPSDVSKVQEDADAPDAPAAG